MKEKVFYQKSSDSEVECVEGGGDPEHRHFRRRVYDLRTPFVGTRNPRRRRGAGKWRASPAGAIPGPRDF